MSKKSNKSKSHNSKNKSQNPTDQKSTYHIPSSAAKLWQPRAEVTYKRIKNKVNSLCGPKQAAQYIKNAQDKHLPLLGYFQHYYGERGAIWARNMINAICAQAIYQNYQISRRSIQIAPRPMMDLAHAMQTDKNAGRGTPNRVLDDQCIFISASELDFETVQGDGIFLSIFNSTSALYCCIHMDEYYCGEISLEIAASSDPYEQPKKDLKRNPDLLKLVYIAWNLFGVLTGGLRLLNEDELIIVQDLGEIRDHTPVRTIMSFQGYDTFPQETSTYLNLLIKTMRWSDSGGMAGLLDSMGIHGTDNFLMVKRAKLFFALQAWANSRQTFRVDLSSFQAIDRPHAADLPLYFFDPDHLPYSAFYVELTGYGAPDEHYGVLIAKSKELSIVSGEDRPEVFLFYNGLVFNEYPSQELFDRLEQTQVTIDAEDLLDLTSMAEYAEELKQRASDAENADLITDNSILIPIDFTFAAVLAVIQVVKTSSEEFILRQVREVQDGTRKKRDHYVVSETRNIEWFLNPRTVTEEIRCEIKVPLDQLIPPADRVERKAHPPKGTRASPKYHKVRCHPRVYWCGPGGREPVVHWLAEFTRGVKPTGVTTPAEVIHKVKL